MIGNPSDVKWLKTALHKGTSKDRSNAGAMLVQTNPLANLETLESLISFTKTTNKNSGDSVGTYKLEHDDRFQYSYMANAFNWK